MKTVIYIDVLIITNFFINLLLLCVTAAFLKTKPTKGRLLCATLIGAVYSLVLLAPNMGLFFSSLSKIAVSVCMTCIAFNGKNPKTIVRQAICFFCMSSLFAGLMLLLKTVFSAQMIIVNNATSYFAVSSGQIAMLAGVCYVLLRLIVNIVQRTVGEKKQVRITLQCENKELCLTAMEDTGNALFEPLTQRAVSLADFEAVRDLLPPQLHSFFGGETKLLPDISSSWKKRIYLIPAQTAVGKALLPCFRADAVCIDTGGKKVLLNDPLFAVSKTKINIENVSVLLHPSLLNGEITGERTEYETTNHKRNPFSLEQNKNGGSGVLHQHAADASATAVEGRGGTAYGTDPSGGCVGKGTADRA